MGPVFFGPDCNRKVAFRAVQVRTVGRYAFTILELLIVLVILGLALTIIWPQMNRRIARSQLKQVAIEFKEDIANAREFALQTGRILELRFVEGSGRYLIGPRESLPLLSPGKPVSGEPINNNNSLETIEIVDQKTGGLSPNPTLDRWVVDRQLDESIVLVRTNRQVSDVDAPNASRPEVETMMVGTEDNRLDSANQINQTSILITPDGRAEDFEFNVLDQASGRGIALRIRGLTGQLEIGDFFVVRSDFADESVTEQMDLGLAEPGTPGLEAEE